MYNCSESRALLHTLVIAGPSLWSGVKEQASSEICRALSIAVHGPSKKALDGLHASSGSGVCEVFKGPRALCAGLILRRLGFRSDIVASAVAETPSDRVPFIISGGLGPVVKEAATQAATLSGIIGQAMADGQPSPTSIYLALTVINFSSDQRELRVQM